MGITGAATASAISVFLAGIFASTKLFQLYRIHPFTANYLKPILPSGAIVAIIYAVIKSLDSFAYWMLPIVFVLILVVHALSLLLTRSFDDEDISLVLAIERRTGVDATRIKNIIRRFI